MKYYKAEFKIECASELRQTARELLADMAGETGFEAFEDTEKGIDGYIQIEFLHKASLDEMIADFPLENTVITYTLSGVVDENWNRTWEEQGFEPINIDGRLLVFDARKPIPDIDCPIAIGIEACQAFGTGTHETTQMILSQLVDIIQDGMRVLDCGCGTGILSLAAARLGAGDVVAYDIDEWSVKNTCHNAMLNGVSNISAMEGDASVLSHVCGVFDVVMANINRNTLIEDLGKYKEVLNGGGTVLLSGFYTEDAPLILEKAAEIGLKEKNRQELNNWCALVLQ
jgi:ribosomal protein L11 methyltransferase